MKKLFGILLLLLALGYLIAFSSYLLNRQPTSWPWLSFILFFALIYQGRIYLFEKVESTEYEFKSKLQINEAISDEEKRQSLIRTLRSSGDKLIVSIHEYFDGNNDVNSIGCNLYPDHPGLFVFQSTFEHLLARDDVTTIWVHISEIEPDTESWPYSDRVYVFGSISTEDLISATKQIQPTEIGDAKGLFSPIPSWVRALSQEPLKVLWWD